MTCLAEYVIRRKVLLNTLDEALRIQDNGNFKKEDVIHSIICPMRHTSDDVPFEEMNFLDVTYEIAFITKSMAEHIEASAKKALTFSS